MGTSKTTKSGSIDHPAVGDLDHDPAVGDLDDDPDVRKAAAQRQDEAAAHEANRAATEAKAADLDSRSRAELTEVAFGALVAALKVSAGERLDIDLTGFERKLPPMWIGRFAALHGMIRDREAATERNLLRRLGPSAYRNSLRAIRDAQGLASAAPELVERLRSLPDVNVRGDWRIRVRHNGYVGQGWKGKQPRPVTVSDVMLPVGGEIELTVGPRDYLRWRVHRSTDVEVLEGERELVATKV